MDYLFHKKLMTSSTDTLIKNTANKVSIIGVIQRNKHHSQNLGVFLSGWHHIFLTTIVPLRHFCYLFFVNLPSPLSWMIQVSNSLILLSCRNIFSNKTIHFRKYPPICVLKNSSSKSFWIISSKVSTVEFLSCILANISFSFLKSCSEQLFCKKLVSGTCH